MQIEALDGDGNGLESNGEALKAIKSRILGTLVGSFTIWLKLVLFIMSKIDFFGILFSW